MGCRAKIRTVPTWSSFPKPRWVSVAAIITPCRPRGLMMRPCVLRGKKAVNSNLPARRMQVVTLRRGISSGNKVRFMTRLPKEGPCNPWGGLAQKFSRF